MAHFVDTNVFIHYLLAVDQTRFERCVALLGGAERGDTDLETSPMVVAELVWFLERPPIRMNATDIRDILIPLVSLRGLRIAERAVLIDALEEHSRSSLSFVDAYNAATMKRRGIETIYSYDRDFDGIAGITRVEP